MTERVEHLAEGVTLMPGDCLDVLKTLEANSVDACVCDPPYGLGREPDPLVMLRAWLDGGHYNVRSSSGFMGKEWDAFVPQPAIWKQVFRVLKPGAHVLAFFGTRTYDLGVLAMRLAGFEVRDSVQWIFGSGFPKSLDVSKAIDGKLGGEREQVREMNPRNPKATGGGRDGMEGATRPWIEAAINRGYHEKDGPIPATAAAAWDGFGTALKPACEPIVLARKPLIGTVAENVLKHGTGALNIDGCRVAGAFESGWSKSGSKASENVAMSGANYERDARPDNVNGRWPANVIHDGSEEVVRAFPESGPAKSGGIAGWQKDGYVGGKYEPIERTGYDDNGGSAARFFYQAKKDILCGLCCLPCRAETDSISSCSVSSAEQILPIESTPTDVFARGDAADFPSPESADNESPLSDHAISAGGHLRPCPPLKADSAQKNVPTGSLSKIARSVSAAANLCSSCATAIAQNLAEVRQTGCAVPLPSTFSIEGYKRTILSRSLASYVASRESTDIILTTTSLKELFGCVFYAIAECTNSGRVGSEANTRPVTKRLWYSAKADADDRIGSKHPCLPG